MRDDETASDSAFASSELRDLVADNPEALSDADFEGVSRDMRTLASPADMLGDMAVSGGALAMAPIALLCVPLVSMPAWRPVKLMDEARSPRRCQGR